MRLFVVGAGGHARDVADIATACGDDVAFLDDRDLPGVVGRPSELVGTLWPHVIAVNDPSSRALLAVGGLPVTLVHPTAVVSSLATLAPGVVVGANACIGPGTRIGLHSHIGAGCTITRTVLGRFCSVGPGVDIAGDVTVGDGTFIGVGARVANMKHIGTGCVIGAGAVVVDHVASGETVAGVPARPLVSM